LGGGGEERKLHCKLEIMTLEHTKYFNISYPKPSSLFFLVLFISTENENILCGKQEVMSHRSTTCQIHMTISCFPTTHLYIFRFWNIHMEETNRQREQ
jgi:hypothetical protein